MLLTQNQKEAEISKISCDKIKNNVAVTCYLKYHH